MDTKYIIYNLLFDSCRFAPQHLKKIEKSAVDPPIILYYCIKILHWDIPESVTNYLCLYFCNCFIPACCLDLGFPNVWYICDISLVFLYFFFLVVGSGWLVDLFFLRRVYTFVSGLFNMIFIFACFLFLHLP